MNISKEFENLTPHQHYSTQAPTEILAFDQNKEPIVLKGKRSPYEHEPVHSAYLTKPAVLSTASEFLKYHKGVAATAGEIYATSISQAVQKSQSCIPLIQVFFFFLRNETFGFYTSTTSIKRTKV